jgi:hypothetical protein
MGAKPIQTRFDGGVISPRLSGRFDSELYKKALRTCDNFQPLPQGSLLMRSGSEKQQILTGDSRTKLAQIRLSTGSDFIVELLDHKAHLYELSGDSAAVQTVGQSQVIVNGDFTTPDGAGWTKGQHSGAGWFVPVYDNLYFADSAGTQLGMAIIHRKTGESPILYQRIVIPIAGSATIKFDLMREQAACKTKVSSTPPTAWADETGGGDIFVFETGVADEFASGVLTTQNQGPVVFAAPGVYYLSFQITQTISSALRIDNVSLTATFGAAITDIPTPWSADEVGTLQWLTETGRDRTVFVHGSHKPWFLLYGGIPGNWTFGDVAFTSLPLAWGDAGSVNVPAGWNWQGQTAFLAQANWPTSIEERDGRIYYAGEPAQRNRILASRSGSSDDFTIGSNPGDALDFKLATKGSIKWLRSHRVMLAGTDLGEFTITGSKGTPLVGDVQARDESAFPTAPVQAITVGTRAIYASSDLRRIRAAAFDLQTNGYESKDVTFAAEHLTRTAKIKELHHVWTPDSLLMGLLDTGSFIACFFSPEEQIVAWWTFAITGTVCSAAPSLGPNGAYLWMAVLRNGVVYLEKLRLSEETILRYLDSSVKVTSNGAGTIAGLSHLGGTARVVKNGGGMIGDFNVVGDVAFLGVDYANTEVIAGIPYRGVARTLPRDLRTGKAQSSKVGVILNDSAPPLINGKYRPKDRGPGVPLPAPITGPRVVGNLGWDEEDSILFEQDLPFRTEICAVYADVEKGDYP